jgi:hypothetical protein
MARGRILVSGIGGPGRRPGSRNRHGQNFLSAFEQDFLEHGNRVIAQVRHERPEVWLKIAADIVPHELERIAGAGEPNIFRSCETIEQIFDMLFDDLGDDPDDVLVFLDTVRQAVLKRMSDRARPV